MLSVRRLACGVAVTWALVVHTACTEPPNKEMNQAQGALDAARAAGAEQFAAEEYKAAVDALEKSRTAVQQRDYRQALSHALDARERAQDAARVAGDEKARVYTATDRELRRAELALDRARASLEGAEAAKVPARQLTAPRQAIMTADRSLREARAAIARDDIPAAANALDGLAARIITTTSEIDAVVKARAERRVPPRSRR